MEVFAGFGEYADTEIGRLVDAIEDIGPARQHARLLHRRRQRHERRRRHERHVQRDDLLQRRRRRPSPDILKHYDELGGPMSYPHMAAGWAVAGDTPFTWTKQVASNFGGTRNGMVVYWPKRIKAKGEVRSQFHHVIDVAPTVLEAAGLPEPKSRERHAPRSRSKASAWSTPSTTRRRRAATRSSTSRSSATAPSTPTAGSPGTIHRAPWEPKPRAALLDDKWELYDTRNDFSLANDLAAAEPGEAQGAAGPVPEGGGQVPRAADRRSRPRARSTRSWSAGPT